MKRTTTTEKERERANQISEESAHKSTEASQETDKGGEEKLTREGRRREPRQIDISIAEQKILYLLCFLDQLVSGPAQERVLPSTIFNARPGNRRLGK